MDLNFNKKLNFSYFNEEPVCRDATDGAFRETFGTLYVVSFPINTRKIKTMSKLL